MAKHKPPEVMPYRAVLRRRPWADRAGEELLTADCALVGLRKFAVRYPNPYDGSLVTHVSIDRLTGQQVPKTDRGWRLDFVHPDTSPEVKEAHAQAVLAAEAKRVADRDAKLDRQHAEHVQTVRLLAFKEAERKVIVAVRGWLRGAVDISNVRAAGTALERAIGDIEAPIPPREVTRG